MMKFLTIFAAALLAFTSASVAGINAAQAETPGANPNAPEQLSHMRNMIGRWAIKDQSLGQDGSWTDGPGADWDFYYTLDGYAIEDIWVQPPRAVDVDDEKTRTVGVNIRKYDPDADKWVMAWITKAPGGVQTFSATSTDEELVMVEDVPSAQGSIRRITFYNMTGATFDWRMEVSSDDGANWREIYRIKGTLKPK